MSDNCTLKPIELAKADAQLHTATLTVLAVVTVTTVIAHRLKHFTTVDIAITIAVHTLCHFIGAGREFFRSCLLYTSDAADE